MKKLITLTIIINSLLSTSALASSTFPCPQPEQVSFTITTDINGLMTIRGTANPTPNMPEDLGNWLGIQKYAATQLRDTRPVLRPTLVNLNSSVSCAYAFPAIFSFNKEPIIIDFFLSPTGPGLNTYYYSGTSSAITADKIPPP